ncbi:unnamed protein product, partial [Medioppia subpectinata]
MYNQVKRLIILLLISSIIGRHLAFEEFSGQLLADESSVPPTIRSPLRFGKRFTSNQLLATPVGPDHNTILKRWCFCYVRRLSDSLPDDSTEHKSYK